MARENRPSATNAEPAQDISAGGLKSTAIVSQTTDSPQEAHRSRVDLNNMTAREHQCHMSGYLSGVLAGIDLGREQMDAELAAIQRQAHGVVQFMARLDPWAVAQERIRNRSDAAAARYREQGQPWPLEIPA